MIVGGHLQPKGAEATLESGVWDDPIAAPRPGPTHRAQSRRAEARVQEIVHNLRTTFYIIDAVAEIASDIVPEAEDHVRLIRSESLRLRQMCADLLRSNQERELFGPP
jgi:hypothetical protein